MGKHFLNDHEAPSKGNRFKENQQETSAFRLGRSQSFSFVSSHKKASHKKSSLRSLVFSIALISTLIFAVTYFFQHKLNMRAQYESSRLLSDSVELEIAASSSTAAIVQKLYDAQLISSKEDFTALLVKRRVDTKLKPGVYQFSPHDSYDKIIDQLLIGGKQEGLKLTIPEGYTVKQTAAQVEKQLGISQENFLSEAKASNFPNYRFLSQAYADSLEGFLYPKTYSFPRGAGAHEVIDTLLKQYEKETASCDFSASSLSQAEVITAASLIERETRVLEERPRIAGVIFNRLNKGMPLQIDASVVYALSTTATKLTLKDLEVDSVYNTYKHKGLPPGPICSPSISSIKAVLQPEKHKYLYYVLTSKDGTHSFSDNYQQFLKDKQEYKRVFSSESAAH